jgi:hypothetical protein
MVVSSMRRPESLFRYRSLLDDPRDEQSGARFDREVRAITESYVWCSNYKAMNDPMEGYYWAEFSKMTRSQAVEDFKNGKLVVGLASFSETRENELMWAHYAGNYSGICIEYQYDMMSEAFGQSDSVVLQPIVYSNEMVSIGDDDLLNRREAIRRILLQKKLCWAYEKEWRLIAGLRARRVLQGTVSRIYLGVRIDQRQKRRLKRLVSEVFPEIEFFQMEVSGYEHVWEAEQ